MNMRLFFRQAARRIATVTIGAAEHDVRGFVHRLDAGVALQAADAFRVRLAWRLIDPIASRTRCAFHSSTLVAETEVGGRNRRPVPAPAPRAQ